MLYLYLLNPLTTNVPIICSANQLTGLRVELVSRKEFVYKQEGQ